MGIRTKISKAIQLRRSDERGRTELDWLDSRHTFSFGDYSDPKHMEFRSLRVINDDRVSPGGGFGTHPHRDMEIITYVIEGELEHKDSLGTGSVIRPGDLQKMSAGTGIMHSEFNPSQKDPVHLLQIWIIPEKNGLKPVYQQISLKNKKVAGLTLVGSRRPKDGVIHIQQDVELFLGRFEAGRKEVYSVSSQRGVWLQLIKGELDVNGQVMSAGDGLAVEETLGLILEARADAEFLLFDLG